MAYFITISFLLHFITFFIIIVLVQKINAKSVLGGANEQEKLKKEIEDLLVAYTIEMKEENEKLVNKLVLKQKIKEKDQSSQIKLNAKQEEQTIKTPIRTQDRPIQMVNIEDTFAPPIFEQTEDIIEQSATAQVLSLANQGFSTNDIAKRLGMGAGEVELLLKFHK
ncbi:hypothetical protein H1D32_20365 [Anaerobacillus sp. CMMVII]|uniref:DUF6115 domain-containing protein n=1 Tax=Anaerobacillus sp. CMMVII TaxID=2755588 RepID=UPI0021B721C3|nr:hypothetical protein [Anaerobacillus sp. CMMVII]MCT8139847.1 hypothetical protein [Anaerobacillus sp. CMMVII]